MSISEHVPIISYNHGLLCKWR